MEALMLIVAAAAVGAPSAAAVITPSQRETVIWNTVRDGDSKAYGAMLAPDYIGVYSDGTFDKAAEVASIHNDHIRSVRLSGFSTRMLSPNDILVTYSADVIGTSNNKDVSGRYWEASTWHRSRDKWLGTFHMEVRARR
jgi:hypothetical protein